MSRKIVFIVDRSPAEAAQSARSRERERALQKTIAALLNYE